MGTFLFNMSFFTAKNLLFCEPLLGNKYLLETFLFKMSFFTAKNLLRPPPPSRTLTFFWHFLKKCSFLARRIYWDRPTIQNFDLFQHFFQKITFFCSMNLLRPPPPSRTFQKTIENHQTTSEKVEKCLKIIILKIPIEIPIDHII